MKTAPATIQDNKDKSELWTSVIPNENTELIDLLSSVDYNVEKILDLLKSGVSCTPIKTAKQGENLKTTQQIVSGTKSKERLTESLNTAKTSEKERVVNQVEDSKEKISASRSKENVKNNQSLTRETKATADNQTSTLKEIKAVLPNKKDRESKAVNTEKRTDSKTAVSKQTATDKQKEVKESRLKKAEIKAQTELAKSVEQNTDNTANFKIPEVKLPENLTDAITSDPFSQAFKEIKAVLPDKKDKEKEKKGLDKNGYRRNKAGKLIDAKGNFVKESKVKGQSKGDISQNLSKSSPKVDTKTTLSSSDVSKESDKGSVTRAESEKTNLRHDVKSTVKSSDSSTLSALPETLEKQTDSQTAELVKENKENTKDIVKAIKAQDSSSGFELPDFDRKNKKNRKNSRRQKAKGRIQNIKNNAANKINRVKQAGQNIKSAPGRLVNTAKNTVISKSGDVINATKNMVSHKAGNVMQVGKGAISKAGSVASTGGKALSKAGGLAKLGGKGAMKAAGRLAGGAMKFLPGVGQALAVGMSIADAVDGYQNAAAISGKDEKDLTTGDRIQAGASSALSGLTFGMVDSSTIFDGLEAVTSWFDEPKDQIKPDEVKKITESQPAEQIKEVTKIIEKQVVNNSSNQGPNLDNIRFEYDPHIERYIQGVY